MGNTIPEEDAAFHDAELVTIGLRKALFVEDVSEDSACLLWICCGESLVEGFEEFVERG